MKLQSLLKFGFLIMMFLFSHQMVVAQNTTTLGKESKKRAAQEQKKRETTRTLANPKPANPETKSITAEKVENKKTKKGIAPTPSYSAADIKQMEDRLAKVEAELKSAKKENSLPADDLAERMDNLEKSKKELEKLKSPIPKKKTVKPQISN